jgi:hypothetical protein
LQNAPVGTPRGSLGENKIRGDGTWSLDGNVSKTFRISESKSLQIRVDATNLFNHPQPANPNLAVSGTTDFGRFRPRAGSTMATPGISRAR